MGDGPGAAAVDGIGNGDAQGQELVANGVTPGKIFGFAGFGPVDELLLDVGSGQFAQREAAFARREPCADVEGFAFAPGSVRRSVVQQDAQQRAVDLHRLVVVD